MMVEISRELICVLSSSLAFMLLFAADYSMSNIQKVVVSSIADDTPGFEMDGYNIASVTYITFAIVVWIGPYITYRIGPKLTMMLSSIGYLLFIISYFFELEWILYLGGMAMGMCAGTLWPALAQYLIENSSQQTTARNFALFNLMLTTSSVLGNIFVYTEFRGKKYLDAATRHTTLYSLSAISICASVAFVFLPKSKETKENGYCGVIKSLKTSFNLLISGKMPWISVTFIYAGVQQAFWNGVYGSCIGFTLRFGNSAKELVALNGIFMGIGALLGSVVPIVLAGPIRRHRFLRRLLVTTGISAQLVTYLIAFVNLPDNSVFGNTEDRSIIEPSASLALLGSLLITIGDASLTTQEYAFIGDNYRHASAEACALYKFVKGVFVSVSFSVCGHVGLHTQLPVMAALAVAGVATFWVADWDNVSHDDNTKKEDQ